MVFKMECKDMEKTVISKLYEKEFFNYNACCSYFNVFLNKFCTFVL